MPKQSIPLLSLMLMASGAVAQFRGVGFSGAQATVQGQKIQGIARTAAADTEKFTADVSGTVIVESGGAFSIGDSLMMDSAGRAIAASALAVASGATPVTSSAANGAILVGGDAPQFVFADALEAATGAGQFVEVLMRR